MKRVLFFGLAVLWSFSAWAEVQKETDTPPTYRDFTVRVLDAWSNEPMPGIEVTAWVGNGRDARITNERGEVMLQVPGDARRVSVRASSGGWVPMAAQWRNLDKGETLPESFDLALPEATVIGGKVTDEEGSPIARARVFLDWEEDADAAIQMDIDDQWVETNDEGKWQADFVPEDLNGLRLKVSHAAFLSDEGYGDREKPLDEALRDETAALVMERGITVRGVVVDAKGEPVPHATLRLGVRRWGDSALDVEADDTGAFLFSNARPGRFTLLATAPGNGPHKQRLNLKEDRDVVEVGTVTLGEAHLLRGRVVDEAGEPLEGVGVSLASWDGDQLLEFETETDETGEWRWLDAPANALTFRLYDEGRMQVNDLMLAAQEEPHETVMLAPLVVRGRVTDAETGEVIEHGVVTPGMVYYEDGDMQQQAWREAVFEGGDYEMSFDSPYLLHHVVVKAPGYAPMVSPGYASSGVERTLVFDVALKTDAGLAGRVVDAQGQAVVGAQVYVATGGQWIHIQNGRHVESFEDDDSAVVTDEEGRFTMPTPADEAYTLAVLSDEGMVVVVGQVGEEVPDLVLEAWGRVEGEVRRGTQVDAGVKIAVMVTGDRSGWGMNDPQVMFEYDVVADAVGQFVIERVVPQKMSIGRHVGGDAGMSASSNSVQVEVEPGETSTVTLGGVGRPVMGHISIPQNIPRADAEMFDGVNRMVLIHRVRESPSLLSVLGFGRPKAVTMEYQAMHAMLDAEGNFKFFDILEGDYRMILEVYGQSLKKGDGESEWVKYASVNHSFSMPPIPGGVTDEPLDLGELPVKTFLENGLEVGGE
ncbi:MAG: carboxypeptidase-like regulatory domain-containing protein [Algisphaera sp.]